MPTRIISFPSKKTRSIILDFPLSQAIKTGKGIKKQANNAPVAPQQPVVPIVPSAPTGFVNLPVLGNVSGIAVGLGLIVIVVLGIGLFFITRKK